MKPVISISKSNDAEINAVVAEYVARWKPHGDGWWENTDSEISYIPQYIRDANAILPLLEKYLQVSIVGCWPIPPEFGWRVTINNCSEIGKTFAKTACFALLRAEGITVNE